jgi:hypothetical protein
MLDPYTCRTDLELRMSAAQKRGRGPETRIEEVAGRSLHRPPAFARAASEGCRADACLQIADAVVAIRSTLPAFSARVLCAVFPPIRTSCRNTHNNMYDPDQLVVGLALYLYQLELGGLLSGHVPIFYGAGLNRLS